MNEDEVPIEQEEGPYRVYLTDEGEFIIEVIYGPQAY